MTSCCVQMRHSFVFKSPHKLHHKDDDAGQSEGKQGLQHQQLLMEKWRPLDSHQVINLAISPSFINIAVPNTKFLDL